MAGTADDQLRWVQENRTLRDRGGGCEVVGAVARGLLASGCLAGPAWRRRLLAVIEEHAGSDLLGRAAVAGLRNGVLRFQVRELGLAYALRLRWEQRLLDLLRAEVPEAGIHTVRFIVAGSR